MTILNNDILKNMIEKTGNKLDENNYKIKYGSGKTTVLIFKTIVVKMFPKQINISKEIDILEKLKKEKYFIKLIDYSTNPNILIYNRVTPLSEIKSLDIKKLLFDIALGLEIIHSKNIIHGDVANTNIGYDGKNFVLFDFETSEFSPDMEKKYYDVSMFLVDLIILYEKNKEIKELLSNILENLENKYVKSTTTTTMFLGKERIRKIKEYNYPDDGFLNVLNHYTF
jgi:serine/threonine protein kinase